MTVVVAENYIKLMGREDICILATQIGSLVCLQTKTEAESEPKQQPKFTFLKEVRKKHLSPSFILTSIGRRLGAPRGTADPLAGNAELGGYLGRGERRRQVAVPDRGRGRGRPEVGGQVGEGGGEGGFGQGVPAGEASAAVRCQPGGASSGRGARGRLLQAVQSGASSFWEIAARLWSSFGVLLLPEGGKGDRMAPKT